MHPSLNRKYIFIVENRLTIYAVILILRIIPYILKLKRVSECVSSCVVVQVQTNTSIFTVNKA